VGTRHHLITFGRVRLDYLRARWDNLVSIVDASIAPFDATAAGVPDGGAILVRPDGFVGVCANPTDEMTMDALDAHLATYLIPNVGADLPSCRCRAVCGRLMMLLSAAVAAPEQANTLMSITRATRDASIAAVHETAFGTKRTCPTLQRMSAFWGKADIGLTCHHGLS